MTLFEALTGGAFDRLNWQHSREFDQNFSKKSNAPGFARGGWAVLELTGTLHFSRQPQPAHTGSCVYLTLYADCFASLMRSVVVSVFLENVPGLRIALAPLIRLG